MVNFFIEGGWGMYPVLVLGLILMWASARYALDMEPARLRFIVALSVALLVTMAHATWTCFAAVFQYLHRTTTEPFAQTLMTGLMESTRPATLGGALLTLAMILVVVGTYRSSQRELRALRG
jgi:hypothetical protein